MAEILKFEVGVSHVIALKYEKGKPCQEKHGPQVQFTTTRDQVFRLDPGLAEEVEKELSDLGIRPGQEFRLTKTKTPHGGHRFVVERNAVVKQEQPESIAAPGTFANLLAGSLCASVDAYQIAAAYAESKGVPFAFDIEDIRASSTVLLIEYFRRQR